MDSHRFDSLTIVLTHLIRRRHVVVMLASGAFALPGAIATVAANKKAKRRRRRRRNQLRRHCLEACGDKSNCTFCLHGAGGGIGCVGSFTPICTQECTGEQELECGLFNGCFTASQPIGGAKKTVLCGGQFATGVCTNADFCM